MTATWTAPRTWIHGELVSAAMGNEQWRDNMDYLISVLRLATLNLSVGNAIAPMTLTPAAIEQIESSAGAPKANQFEARFDAAADEHLQWQFVLPTSFSGTMILNLYYFMASATSGNVVWAAMVSAKGDGDSGMTARVFDDPNTATSAVPGTAGNFKVVQITLTNDDGMAGGDNVILDIYRDADNGSDTATGDAVLTDVRPE